MEHISFSHSCCFSAITCLSLQNDFDFIYSNFWNQRLIIFPLLTSVKRCFLLVRTCSKDFPSCSDGSQQFASSQKLTASIIANPVRIMFSISIACLSTSSIVSHVIGSPCEKLQRIFPDRLRNCLPIFVSSI